MRGASSSITIWICKMRDQGESIIQIVRPQSTKSEVIESQKSASSRFIIGC